MINRRELLLSLATLGLAQAARAEAYCTPEASWNTTICNVFVDGDGLLLPQQECQNWCWAASISAAFSLQRYRVDQKRLVDKLHGSDSICEVATGRGIQQAINGTWEDDDGKSFSARLGLIIDRNENIIRDNPFRAIITELENGRALIAGSLGHATVITGVEFRTYQNGYREILQITVHDPWPYNQSPRYLTRQEVQQGQFLATVYTQPV